MANQLREWLQNDVINPLGVKAGLSGTLNASQVKDTILSLPDTTELRNTIKGLIEGKQSEITIPGYVEEIKEYAFYKDGYIYTLHIEDGVKKINSYAFSDCYSISNIYLPISLQEISSNALHSLNRVKRNYYYNGSPIDWLNVSLTRSLLDSGKNDLFYFKNDNDEYYNLENLVIPSNIETVPAYSFTQNKTIKSIVLEEGVKTLKQNCFSSLSNLEQLVIPNSVTLIENNAIGGVGKITEFTTPTGLNEIPQNMFNGWTLLQKLNITSNITTIRQYGINTSKLLSLTIPRTVTILEQNSVQIGSSSNKATIIMESEIPPTIQYNTFKTNYLHRIYVPKGYSSTYKENTNWSNYANYIFEPNNITFNVATSLLNNENVLYSIDNGEEQQFTQSSFTGENLSTLTVTSKASDIVVKVGTTQGGSEIGTVANATTTFTFESDTTVYITQG